jgi:transcriptional regulator with GAF, ATPase, and Fis domain
LPDSNDTPQASPSPSRVTEKSANPSHHQEVQIEEEVTPRNGERFSYPIFDRDGKVARVIEVVQDLPMPETGTLSDPSLFNSDSPVDEDPASFFGMIGGNKKMKALFQTIRLVSPSNATVLIYGESGTGKELVAHAIHQNSSRRNRPFVAIDCGSLSETLLESELFGHVKGAFTGAIQSKRGLFEEAEGGTLFLDEIGDSSLAFQAKLLRILQEGEARPVGSNRTVKVDVRVIAATNKGLKEAIEKKTFRGDLYYRLAVIPMVIPSLRERPDDIPLLANYFIKKYAAQNGKAPMQLSEEAIAVLLKAPWEGNVRELQNVIERSVLVSPGPTISPDAFLIDEAASSAVGAPSTTSLLITKREVSLKFEKERIIEAIRKSKGNKSLAAQSLGIARASLYNKLKQFQIGTKI